MLTPESIRTVKPRATAPLWQRPGGGSASRALLAAALFATGCGYVGDPLPPALNIPAAITGLRAVQRGDRIYTEFTVPRLTTEGLVLRKPFRVELRAGPSPAEPFQMEQWQAAARLVEVAPDESGSAKAEIDASGWGGKEVIIAARLHSARGRAGQWSDLLVLPVVEALPPPANLKAEMVPGGVRVSWDAPPRPGIAFRIFRRAEGQEEAEAARVEAREWVDTAAEQGKRVEYRVVAVLTTGRTEAASEPSAPLPVAPKDVSPPATPAGLLAQQGAGSVELTWERNTEPDLAGYRLYRSTGDGDPARIAGPLETPGFSDRTAEPGRRYTYRVSAVDAAGNESPLSAPAEVVAPEK